MPVKRCTHSSGKSGYKWGNMGKCYLKKADAEAQGAAIEANKILSNVIEFSSEPINKENNSLEATIVQKSVDEEKRLFYAVVLEPMTEVTESGDAHGHVMTEEEVEKSAHFHMEMGPSVAKDHRGKVDARVVESYIAMNSFTPEGSEVEIKKGSWIMAVKIYDDEIWEAVKSGEITAFSPGGYAVVEENE